MFKHGISNNRERIGKLGVHGTRLPHDNYFFIAEENKTSERGLRQEMSKSYMIRRSVIECGHSKCVTLPNDWKSIKADKVDMEIFDDKIVITPVEK